MKYYILAGENIMWLVIITSLAIKWFHKYIHDHDYLAFTSVAKLLVDLQ